MNITKDTITIAVDLQGGMCDRLMLGQEGIINNAKASVDCWKFNAPDDDDLQTMPYPTDVEHALMILSTDNFHVEVVTSSEQIKKLLQDDEVNINLKDIEFKDNIFRIY